jgi:hypothetical protein
MADTLAALAGTMPDGQVAARLDIDVDAVKTWRRDHGIPPFLKPPPETGKAGPVMTHSAPVVAEQRGRAVVRRRPNQEGVVAVAYEERRAPAPPLSAQPAQSTPSAAKRGPRASASARLSAVRQRLGTVPDQVIAKELGVSRGIVGIFRRKHGIEAYEGYLFEPGHAPARGSTGRATTGPTPRNAGTGRRVSRIDAFSDIVGKVTDAVVAKKAGVTRAAVAAWRHRQGIEAAVPKTKALLQTRDPSTREPAAPATRDPLDRFTDRLGKVSDSEIADLAGVNRSTVVNYRQKLGIAAWQGFRTKPRRRRTLDAQGSAGPARVAPAPKAIVPAAPAFSTPAPAVVTPTRAVASTASDRKLYAYTEVVSFGEDIVAACIRVEAALETRRDGPWLVDSIRFLGDALA